MLVRIRVNQSPGGGKTRLRKLALALAALLTPAALVAFTVCFWSIAASFQLTSVFFISHGVFSHWQAWLLTAALLLCVARLLNRWAKRELPAHDDVLF